VVVAAESVLAAVVIDECFLRCPRQAFLFDALVKRCLIESREKSAYSRCGRTDKGVSAFSQIITLRLRSKARTAGTLDKPTKTALEFDEVNGPDTRSELPAVAYVWLKNMRVQELPPPAEEIDYPVVINSGLPEDIRVLGWCDMPETFSARFNARHRTYRYFFPKRSLDIDAMREGAKLLLGRHDFRNLCKIDVMHVDNFERYGASLCVSVTHCRGTRARVVVGSCTPLGSIGCMKQPREVTVNMKCITLKCVGPHSYGTKCGV
jgi:tRNA pseudouridine(38-40) synthase